MNRERAKELLPIIQAFAEGKDIQCKDQDGNWHTDVAKYPDFSRPNEWRIKPEPREFTIVRNGRKVKVYESHDIAFPDDVDEIIKVREVIE